MPRTKVKFALIENEVKRKASYKQRLKGLFKMAYELTTLCGVEMAITVYSPYQIQPILFPNNANAFNTFKKFSELSVLDQSKHMMTGEEFTKRRTEKLEKQLHKVRKENRVNECTNKMYRALKEIDIPADMNPYDLNDLSFVIKQNLKQVCEMMKAKIDGEGSTLNARQPMVSHGTNSEEPRAHLVEIIRAPVSIVPLVAPSTAIGAANFEGLSTDMLVPVVDPISMVPPADPSMVPPADPSMAPQADPLMVLQADPLMVPSSAPAQMPKPLSNLMDPLVKSSRSSPPPFSPFSLENFPEMFVQSYPPLPQEMAFRGAPRMAPPTKMASPIPSTIITPPMTCSEPSMASSSAPVQMLEPRTPQPVPFVDPSRFPPLPLSPFSLDMFPPMFPQLYPP
ncbi:agamous-like MADS-box protein AGL80 [Solanum lycopersicum]|uniref:agamous-like MADS-box protein AGL80 n=1 Tax=Solanum lycopersicum TaxID=4081 RepID=UPI0037491F85